MIVHFTKPDPRKSSRTAMQLEIAGGKAVHIRGLRAFWRALVQVYRSRRRDTCVFHQQASLPFFLLCLPALYARGCTIVYDIHDLVIVDNRRGPRILVRNAILYACEWVVFHLPRVRPITVSQGLASVCHRRYGRRPEVVYNLHRPLAQTSLPQRPPAAGDVGALRFVYFGLINPVRLDLPMIESVLAATGGELDVWGVYDAPGFDAAIARTPHIHYRGEYRAADLAFLKGYDALWFVTFAGRDLNWRYCMPNKLFQALESGLCLCIPDTFREIADTFASEPIYRSEHGAVLLIRPDAGNLAVLARLKADTVATFTRVACGAGA